MNYETLFMTVQGIVQRASDPASGWRGLVELARDEVGSSNLATLDGLDFPADVRRVRMQIVHILCTNPLPESVDTLYFGLFDQWIDGSDKELIGFYVSGVEGFDPEWRVGPQWFPDNRFLDSRALQAIKALADAITESRAFFEYGLALGAASLLARYATVERTASLQLVVGFDEGDYLVLPTTAPN